MAPKLKILDASEDTPVAAPTVDYVCGLRKMGPSLYSVVTGKIVNGVPTLRVDPIAQSLGHASGELQAELHKLMVLMP